MSLEAVAAPDLEDLSSFLSEAELTLAGLGADTVHLWVQRNTEGRVVGSTGFELSHDGSHALIRSVAVDPAGRASGVGSRLAMFALTQARHVGAEHAWLFSRRSGPFWQKLGFKGADRDSLANVLSDTRQVRLFIETGQLEREVAWSRDLSDLSR